jgi:hypothetical protein
VRRLFLFSGAQVAFEPYFANRGAVVQSDNPLTFVVDIKNTGAVASDVVVLCFVSSTTNQDGPRYVQSICNHFPARCYNLRTSLSLLAVFVALINRCVTAGSSQALSASRASPREGLRPCRSGSHRQRSRQCPRMEQRRSSRGRGACNAEVRPSSWVQGSLHECATSYICTSSAHCQCWLLLPCVQGHQMALL